MHLESFCSFLYCRRKFFATDPAISDIFSDGFRALFTHFLGIFFLLLLLLSFVFVFWCFFLFSVSVLAFCFVWFFVSSSNLSTSMSASATASPVVFGFGFVCVWVWSFVLGGAAAAVSGKCYLTASVTLHNCSHFLDCATVAVAVAVAALLKFIVVLSLLPHIRCHGWCPEPLRLLRAHYTAKTGTKNRNRSRNRSRSSNRNRNRKNQKLKPTLQLQFQENELKVEREKNEGTLQVLCSSKDCIS